MSNPNFAIHHRPGMVAAQGRGLMPVVLGILFFVTAGLYASVGFGGGSTYNALLVLSGVDYQILPAIALTCNIIVVTGGAARFWKSGDVRLKALLPFMITSVPCAWLGGRLEISETAFIGALGITLLLSGWRLAVQSETDNPMVAPKKRHPLLPFAIGGSIGFLSGMVGIGGGIFLAPVLYFLSWDTPRKIAAACSLFILANSVSGLLGQVSKLNDRQVLSDLIEYWPLMVAVFLGGQIGSWAASQRLQPSLIKRLTAVLILFVSIRLLYRWGHMIGLYG